MIEFVGPATLGAGDDGPYSGMKPVACTSEEPRGSNDAIRRSFYRQQEMIRSQR